MNHEEENAKLRARVAELEAVIGRANSDIAAAFKLPPAMNRLFSLLLAVPFVTSDMVTGRLNIATDVKVAMFRLRRMLEPYDIKVHARRYIGYWIDQSDKARIRAMLEEHASLLPEQEAQSSEAA